MTWQSSLDVNFVITMGDSSSPIFETEAIDNQKDFKYTVSSTEYYSFCWKTKQKELLGFVFFKNFSFYFQFFVLFLFLFSFFFILFSILI